MKTVKLRIDVDGDYRLCSQRRELVACGEGLHQHFVFPKSKYIWLVFYNRPGVNRVHVEPVPNYWDGVYESVSVESNLERSAYQKLIDLILEHGEYLKVQYK